MILILSTMLGLTLMGALLKNGGKEKENEPVAEESNQTETVVIPSSFKGQIGDEFDVPDEVMNIIVKYMDAYYRALFTLETEDISSMFENERMARISDRAIALVVETHRAYDFDFTLKNAHYDLKVTGYENDGDRYTVELLEDDSMYFSFLEGIESKTYDIENRFVIVRKDGACKIKDLEKVQGYYMTFYDEGDTLEKIDEIYDYYSRELKDMMAYNNEVLKVKAAEKPYLSDRACKKAYDREKAVAYADQYHHERNPLWYNFTDEGGNCQNYASQCMLEGGIEMDYYGDEQWKCYVEDPDYEPEINEEETAHGRTRSWVNVGYFYNYAKWNEDRGLVADANVNLNYAQPGDIILVGNEGPAHTVIVSKVVNGHILVDSNSIDMKDYPIEAYTYTGIMLIKILGCN